MTIYGPNGSGKSSFVDGLEVCVRSGKIEHLAHEYSGRFQEKGIVNTHRPRGATTSASVTLADSKVTVCEWYAAGAPRISGEATAELKKWEYRRVALRQDEIAAFIKASKGEKYSALLPLLGLQHLETAAENLRRLGRETIVLSKLDQLRRQVAQVEQRRKSVFGQTAGTTELLAALRQLDQRYVGAGDGVSPNEVAGAVADALQQQLNSLDAQSRQAAALQEIANSTLPKHLADARETSSKIKLVAEPLVKERLEVLNAALVFHEAVDDAETSIKCPACGTEIEVSDFRAHVATERERLQTMDGLFASHKEAVASVCDDFLHLRNLTVGRPLTAWRSAQSETLKDTFKAMQQSNVAAFRIICTDDDLASTDRMALAVIDAAKASAGATPPGVQELILHNEQTTTIREHLGVSETIERVRRIEALLAFLSVLEDQVREEIIEQAKAAFGSISTTIQTLWNILHPSQKISDVHLHVPKEADKAIDVALTFYGVEQQSPRLTLSEGQRNALGLCLFLAMAKQETGSGRPIILDDVVISLDRDHRSHVAKLLEEEFADRQIILLTHDREWFFELGRFLSPSRWQFQRLLPWDGPAVGIRFADHATDFAKARSKIGIDPEDAESNVRRIMDQALSEIAEKLEITVPHLRGDENDHRSAGQFIPRIAARAKKAFRVRNPDGATFSKNTDAVLALETVAPQLVAWANRATHTFSASRSEAEAVVDNCERALNAFTCTKCDTSVWNRTADSGARDCRCGQLQWKD
jgi:ABC-type cobalamin/Fe3+-siderophores transport system ATPase subunit